MTSQMNIDADSSPTTRLVDTDDDVRAVAAACLLPVAEALSERLSFPDLERLLHALWDTFLEDSDELNSSVASVMELLSKYSTCFQIPSNHPLIDRLIP